MRMMMTLEHRYKNEIKDLAYKKYVRYTLRPENCWTDLWAFDGPMLQLLKLRIDLRRNGVK